MLRRTDLVIPVAACAALLLAGCAVEAESSAPESEVTYKTVRVKKSIPFTKDTVKTAALDKGESVVDQQGRPGVRVRVVRVALQDGVEVGRDVLKTYVKRKPVQQVKLVGTHVDAEPAAEPEPEPEPEAEPAASSCDDNYAGACVPIASDVDCAGGSGDGPEYVEGPVRVVGSDVYDLNRDSDDIACD